VRLDKSAQQQHLRGCRFGFLEIPCRADNICVMCGE
jgi:hypothetical protein